MDLVATSKRAKKQKTGNDSKKFTHKTPNFAPDTTRQEKNWKAKRSFSLKAPPSY